MPVQYATALVGLGVSVTDGAAQHSPAAAYGDLAEFLRIEVHQVTGMVVFVAAHDPCGGPVQPAQPGEPVSGQDLVDRGGMQAQQAGDPRWSHRRSNRTLMMRRSVRVGVRLGLRRGRLDRSVIPASPWSR